MKLRHVQSHQLLSRLCEKISTFSREEITAVANALFRATKDGIHEIVFEMGRTDTSILQYRDRDGRSIFMVAVLNRQAEIFSLIYGLKRKKALLAGADDVFRNNILHMAGMLTPSTPINHIPGAALQMQRELQWFKEVESIVPPRVKNMLNKDRLTPKQLFSLSHEDLRKKGEKWMQSTSTSCTVVGTLIITIMFAVAFTVPGGNNRNTDNIAPGTESVLHRLLIGLWVVR
ncbi:hypothetical protein CJ030_MR7G001974 [Morella rubra]|uniref:PGG domain-containing protein n=1 Tax=Morella rubra TaxID=262757 RepID=A0A6A1WX31_9ROSI|nr:hypothetical protein CJ030_MR7G001974 [Morella rubra]